MGAFPVLKKRILAEPPTKTTPEVLVWLGCESSTMTGVTNAMCDVGVKLSPVTETE